MIVDEQWRHKYIGWIYHTGKHRFPLHWKLMTKTDTHMMMSLLSCISKQRRTMPSYIWIKENTQMENTLNRLRFEWIFQHLNMRQPKESVWIEKRWIHFPTVPAKSKATFSLVGWMCVCVISSIMCMSETGNRRSFGGKSYFVE